MLSPYGCWMGLIAAQKPLQDFRNVPVSNNLIADYGDRRGQHDDQ